MSSDYASAEAVHDWFHGYLGNGGHMVSLFPVEIEGELEANGVLGERSG